MQKALAILSICLLLVVAGCHSNDPDAEVFHTWGCENAKELKSKLEEYRNVLVVRVDEGCLLGNGPGREEAYHFKTTVIKSYRGDWKPSEKLAFAHYVDSSLPAGTRSNLPPGGLIIVLTSEHTNTELSLETGDWFSYEDFGLALERVYPNRNN